LGNGTIGFEYRWDPSTGNPDLYPRNPGVCEVGEHVLYNPWPFPNPPFVSSLPNPHDINVPATDGVFSDIHETALVPPYSSVTVNGNQIYRTNCRCGIGQPEWTTLNTPFGGIVRKVEPNGSGGWMFTISKAGLSSTKNPL